MWNVFINEGILKEHQQRFLRGKQEKEKTFIKAQFFERKPFLLIVGNIQNLRNNDEDDEEIMKIKEKIDSINKNNLDNKLREIIMLSNALNNEEDEEESPDKKEKNTKSHKLNMNGYNTNYNGNFGDNSSDDNKSFGKTTKDEVFRRLYKSKKEEIIDEKLVKDNQVKFFELINDYLLLVIYANDGCSLLYKIDWNKSMKENISEISHKKWKADE